MTVGQLIRQLEELPEEAELFVSENEVDVRKMDRVTTVGRLLAQGGTKGQGGKVVAGIILFDCKHT